MLRDTDEDWKGISGEPFYGVFSNTDFFRERLTEERLEGFWESGRVEIDSLLGKLRQHFGPFDPHSAIDFGCGVGRLTRGISRHVGEVFGIDVAPKMLEEARRWAPDNAVYGHDFPDRPVDWINSIIVFQHIHPSQGFPLLQRLLDHLAPDGGLTLQLTFYKDREAIAMATDGMDAICWDGESLRTFRETPHPSGTMMMYDYDLGRVMAMLHAAGVNNVLMEHSNHGGNHGVFILGRRR